MVIESRNNPLVKKLIALRDKKFRREFGEYIVEGVKQIKEASAGGCKISAVVYAKSYKGELFSADSVYTVSDSVFEKISEEVSPQGILAVLKIPDTAVYAPQGKCLLLDGISDPGNLGTILRTANAFGYTDIYLNGCVDPFSGKCIRAAMSGVFFVRIHIGAIEDILAALSGVPKICADMAGENVCTFQSLSKYCLVIGNEANGVSDFVRKVCEFTVKIPMRESCESLNAAVSAGILMYELLSDKINL